jgi:hypothetical protein
MDWQGLALTISTTTALLAVGAPFALRWWEERDRQRREKKAQIEQHLFFVLENYALQWVKFYNWQSRYANADRNNDPLPEYDQNEIIVEGFQSHLVHLRMLKQLYRLDDAGFCAQVEKYLQRTTNPVPRYATMDERVQAVTDFGDLVTDQRNSVHAIEAASVAFLRNIAERFGT